MSTTPRRSFGSIEKRGHSYRARYKRFGTWHSAPHQFTTKGAARQWLDREKWLIDNDALGRGTWTPPAERAQQVKLKEQQDALTLVVWVQQHLDRLTEIKDSSRQTYQRYIDSRLIKPTSPAAQRFANTPITDITRTMAYDWWDAITEEFNTPSTNHKAHQLVRSAMEAAVERELIPANPINVKAAKRRPETKDKRLPTDEELWAVVNNMPPHYRLAAVLCLFMGLRVNEALALERKHLMNTGTEENPQWGVQVRQSFSRVPRSVDPSTRVISTAKTKAGERDVPIFPMFNDIITNHMQQHEPKDNDSFLTLTAKGFPVLDTSFREAINRANEKANIPKDNRITPHYGRNWLITRLAENGATPQEIGRVLGQKDLKTITETYMKVRPERVDAIMSQVGESIAGGNVVDLDGARRAKRGGA